jgi:hypothetical protein
LGVCQSERGSAAAEVAPQRIVGLQYPHLALLAAIQGTVELEAAVSIEGTVKGVKAISGHPLLIDAFRICACEGKLSSGSVSERHSN